MHLRRLEDLDSPREMWALKGSADLKDDVRPGVDLPTLSSIIGRGERYEHLSFIQEVVDLGPRVGGTWSRLDLVPDQDSVQAE